MPPIGRSEWLALPIDQQLDSYARQITDALPSHIAWERFRRVVLTAVQQNPDLRNPDTDRRSLFLACVRAASDGLLPDGRQGALVIYKTRVKRRQADGNVRDEWAQMVQWMPMYQGLIERIRRTGMLASIAAHVVYAKDEFAYTLGDDESISHRPALGADRGAVIGAYAIAKLTDGTVQREWMSFEDIDRARLARRGADKFDTPAWRDWPDQMARKCVIRRLCKFLPMQSDLEDAYRDESFGDRPREVEQRPATIPPRPTRATYALPPVADPSMEEVGPQPVGSPPLSDGDGTAAPEPAQQPAAAPAPPYDDQEPGEIVEGISLIGATGHEIGVYKTAEEFITALRRTGSNMRNTNSLQAILDNNEATLATLPPPLVHNLKEDFKQYAVNLSKGNGRKV